MERSSEISFFSRTRPAGCPCRDRSPTRHVPSHWDSLVDLLQHFNYSADLPLLYCFLSVKSHNKGQQLRLGVIFHLHWPPVADFWVFLPLLIFSFHIAFAQTPPKIKFLILWPWLTAFIENSLAKSGIFSGISLAHLSTALKSIPRPLAHSYG